ncbi:hypothetical protein [Streptomyces sp. NPDC056883]|uniref:hypothetical protein n=1 Tax=Streptomyces sp. NPDC056883 TaxID=3345959 RepID=UPI00368B6EC2
MFTGTPEQLRQREEKAGQLAEQVAELLNQIDALGIGTGNGQLHTPGGQIRQSTNGWTVC